MVKGAYSGSSRACPRVCPWQRDVKRGGGGHIRAGPATIRVHQKKFPNPLPLPAPPLPLFAAALKCLIVVAPLLLQALTQNQRLI